jgi:hypothetical protein
MEVEEHVVNWKDLKQHPSTFCTDKLHHVAIQRETVPIIFVPGIMGTRLWSRDSKKIVWDPSHGGFMAKTFMHMKPSRRKEILIDDKSVDVLRKGDLPENDAEFDSEVSALIDPMRESSEEWDWNPDPQDAALRHQKLDPSLAYGGSPPQSLVDAGTRLLRHNVDAVTNQGWGEISFGDYLPYMLELAQPGAMGDYASFFQCPVYGFGYNFLNDNLQSGYLLGQKIHDVIKLENAKPGRYCNYVILVSHSMGGLVVRSALKHQQIEPHVLGVVHGFQPVTGSPAGYTRMRAGFEPDWYNLWWVGDVPREVLGKAARDVVPILGNCIGGLELLPTSAYVEDYNKSKQWLGIFQKDGQVATKPQGDPYGEIYGNGNPQDFWRLVSDGSQLLPDASASSPAAPGVLSVIPASKQPRSKTSSTKAPNTLDKQFLANLQLAKTFQKLVTPAIKHSNSYQIYGRGMDTFHQARWRAQQDKDQVKTAPPPGEGVDLDPNVDASHGGEYFALDKPDPDSGDGTVPISSGSALGLDPTRTYVATGVPHQGCFANKGVKYKSREYVQTILNAYKVKCGC